MAQAFSPQTQLLYIPTIRSGGAMGSPGRLDNVSDRDTTRLKAWNPVTQKEVWSVKTPGFWNGGVLATAGNLVFEGMGDGKFNAYHAGNGKPLWSFDAHYGIAGSPISYEVDGKQYVSIVAGWGGTGATASGEYTHRYGWQARIHTNRLLTFALDAKTVLPPQPPPMVAKPIDDPKFVIDPKRAQAGVGVYLRSMCLGCHGFTMIAGGHAPDLRASPVPLSAAAFREIVKNGTLLSKGMPSYPELTDDELESLRHFIRQRARETLKP
jgi:quinohemoprotein ethanol dehydrogenase